MSTAYDVLRDIRYAVRMLRKAPVFSAVAILTLALAIGVNAAVFSVINAFIFRPLPVANADRLVVIACVHDSGPSLRPMSYPDLQDIRHDAHEYFEDIAGYSVGFLGLAVDDERPARVLVSWVTGNYFSTVGVDPFLGRLFRDGDGRPGTDRIAVVGHATWQDRFGADPLIVGRTVRLNRDPYTIVGIAPPGFLGTFAFSRSELFLPATTTGGDGLDDRSHRVLHTIGRLRPGITRGQAQAAVDVIAARCFLPFIHSSSAPGSFTSRPLGSIPANANGRPLSMP